MATPIFDRIVRGVAWVSAAKIVAQIIGTGVSIVLARLLVPSDFGLVAMISVFTGFVTVFGELGLGAALVQRNELDDEQLSSVFWINVITGSTLCAVVAGAAPVLARFYEEPRLLRLTLALSFNFLLAPLNMVHNAILAREMRFSAVAAVETTSVIVSAALVVVLALRGWGVWSLVAQSLCSTLVSTCVLWSLSRWRPRRIFKWSAVRDLIRFSAHLLGFSTINYWARKSDDLLIGKVMGAAPLGIYDRAYSTMMLPINEVSAVLGRVMFPALSKMQNDKERVKAYYLRALSMIALVTFPIMLVLCVLADPIILVLYGPRWAPVASVLKILCVVGTFQSIGTTVGWIYQSQGRTDVMFRWGAVASALIIMSLVVGVWMGTLEWVAICYAIMTVGVLSYPQFAIPGRLIGMRVREVIGAIYGVLSCAGAAAALVWALDRYALATLPAGPRLVVLLPVAAASYLALLRGFKVDAFVALSEFIAGWRRERSAKAAAAPATPPENSDKSG
jgi:PST family polysaccharide transporter